jgi:hypothetical protein
LFSYFTNPWTADHLFDGTFLEYFKDADIDKNKSWGAVLSLFDVLASIKEKARKSNKK